MGANRIGMDRSTPIYKAWFPMHEEEDGAREIGAIDVGWAARNHADYAFRHMDGYEWKWPLTCVVIDPAGERFAVSIEMELVPSFTGGREQSFDELKPAVHCSYDSGSRCRDVRLETGSPHSWPTTQGFVTFKDALESTEARAKITCEKCAKSVADHIAMMKEIDARGEKLQAERNPDKPECTNNSPPWFTGRWRDWHRGHGCNKDDGKPRSAEADAEIAAHGGAS